MVDMKNRPQAATTGPALLATTQNRYNSETALSATLISIRKNSREELRISIDEFRGRRLLNFRIWYQPTDGGEMRPGRDGVAISAEKLPEIAAALAEISRSGEDAP